MTKLVGLTCLSNKENKIQNSGVRMKNIIIAISILTLAGCSSKFTKPLEGFDNAQIRFVSIPSNNNFIHIPAYNTCISGNGIQQMTTLGSKANLIRSLSRNGVPLYDSNISDSHQNEVYIPAGGEFAFQFNGVGITGFSPGVTNTKDGFLYSWCRKIVRFNPEAGGFYEAQYHIIENDEGKETCGVKLFEISQKSNGEYEKNEAKNYDVIHRYCGS